MELSFATSNENKVREASMVLGRYGISINQSPLRKIEIQSGDLAEIVEYALSHLCVEVDDLVVEDDGLFVRSLNGFPGPYAAYAYSTIGVGGLLKLMQGVIKEERLATFKSVVGACVGGRRFIVEGAVDGVITEEPRGSSGFGFDPVFSPLGDDRTFAEMSIEEKSRRSHRALAFSRLAERLLKEGAL